VGKEASNMFDLLLKGADVIDPDQGIHEVLDVAIRDGKIVRLQKEIAKEKARKTLELEGKIVVPGLIDLHSHVYWKGNSSAINPDDLGRRTGVTTFVDAGSAGAGNFPGFKEYVIDSCRSRILAFLNISYPGMFCLVRGLQVGELMNLELANVAYAVKMAEQYPKDILGIKIRLGVYQSGYHGLAALLLAKQAAEYVGKPVMVHISVPPPTAREILPILERRDVLTHCYRGMPNSLMGPNGEILPELVAARKRGVIIDVGHGIGSFSFKVAKQMIEQGFLPDTISSDIHALGLGGPTFDLPTTLSKLLNLGMNLDEVIRASTASPAEVIGLQGQIGTLREGSIADIAVFKIEKGVFRFTDCADVFSSFGEEMEGHTRITPLLTIKNGQLWT